VKALLLWSAGIAAFLTVVCFYSTVFPGTNLPYAGEVTSEEAAIAASLQKRVDSLCGEIGERRAPSSLDAAADHLARQFRQAGFEVTQTGDSGQRVVVAESAGRKEASEVLVLCAHYDTPAGSPGADGNASGCAVLIEVASILSNAAYDRTLRYVLLPDGARAGAAPEGMADSAAARYAQKCLTGNERLVGVINLDSVGTFEKRGEQRVPLLLDAFYPDQPDFVAVVGSYGSRTLVEKTVAQLRTYARMPIEGLVLPEFLPGASFSDHAGFWAKDVLAVTVTTTGPYRSAHWGTAQDTPDRLNYQRMARLVIGVSRSLAALAKRSTLT
jgi:hypothetical protein